MTAAVAVLFCVSMKPLKKLVEYFQQPNGDTQSGFAGRLGVSQGLVGQWQTGRSKITPEMAPAVERETGGFVKCEDIHPKFEWERDAAGKVLGYRVRFQRRKQRRDAASQQATA